MKNLFLLLALGVGITASAQKAGNAPENTRRERGMIELRTKAKVPAPAELGSTSNKSSDGTTGEWFCFSDAIYTQNTSEYSFWPVYPDSTAKIFGTNTFNWYLHGMGTSFDPTSTKFGNLFSNSSPYYPQPTFGVSTGNPYTVDSVGIIGWYDRPHTNVVDTLDIYVVAAPSTGAWNITWTFNGDVAPYWGRTDSQLQVAQCIYDWQTNSIKSDSVPGVVHIQKLLNDAAFADSSYFPQEQTYLHMWNFAIPGSLSVPAGGSVIAYTVFRKAFTYPMNADIDTINKWNHLTEAVQGGSSIPNQIPNDYNGGLAAFTEDRYHLPGFWDLNNGSVVLAPTYNYTPVYMADPWYAFFVKCPACDPASVKGVENNTAKLNVYPNPANDQINITFTAEQKGDAKIAIVSVAGQLVDSKTVNVKGASTVSFSTSNLSNGTYFYTVEMNGKKTSTTFVVNH